MKYKFITEGLTCPHCSTKIENELNKNENLKNVCLNIINQTITVESKLDKNSCYEMIKNTIHKYEPDVNLSYEKKEEKEDNNILMILRIIITSILFITGLLLTEFTKIKELYLLLIYIIGFIFIGYDILFKAIKNIFKGRIFDENFLMTISSISAFIIKEFPEAVAIMLFYQIGEFFQDLSVKKSRKSIKDLMDLSSESAFIIKDNKTYQVSPKDLKIDDIIIVKPGEKIPVDGVIIEGSCLLDTKALTGESLPINKKKDDEVLSGTINLDGVLKIKVTKLYSESTISKILELVENASTRKAKSENLISKFAKFYTPIVVILAILITIIPPIILNDSFISWIKRGIVFLVVSCPCALVISIPLTFFGGIGASSKKGILIKGSNYLEALNKVNTVVLDKTGTITKGEFIVNKIISYDNYKEDNVLEYAALCESYSNHPIASSIIKKYNKKIDNTKLTDYKELSGYGVKAIIDNNQIYVGNDKFMTLNNIDIIKSNEVGSKIYVALDDKLIGLIIIKDVIKNDSKEAIDKLKNIGINNIYMLTGDNKESALEVKNELNIECYYELLPNQKVEKFNEIKNGTTIFIGDGINDAPVLANADIGISMGGIGSDAAIEASDIVIMNDSLLKITQAIKIAKRTRTIVIENIIFAITIKILFLILGAIGLVGMWEAVFADVGVALIAVLNAMRIMRK